MRQIIFTALIVYAILSIACGGGTTNPTEPNCDSGGDTPTAAYKRLFDAVKSKQTENIKAQMTQNTVQFASSVSHQNKTPLEKVFENGFTATTFAPSLPDIRDERTNCNMGAIEVWNAKNNAWEDLPFMIENGHWKLAVGDLFKGSYKSPGKGLATREAEAANAARGNTLPNLPAANTNRPVNIPLPSNAANRANSR
jgi:hypothetical protein